MADLSQIQIVYILGVKEIIKERGDECVGVVLIIDQQIMTMTMMMMMM